MAQVKVDQELYKALLKGGPQGAINFSEARAMAMIKGNGANVGRDLLEHIGKNAVAEVKKLTSDIRKAHFSKGLNDLLEATSKKDALKTINSELVLTEDELVTMITDPYLFGFDYRCKHREFVPSDLQNFNSAAIGKTDPDTGRLTDEAKKAFNIIGQIIKTRRQLSVHWFQFNFEWHCFYFDFGDLLKEHWVGGDHIHYLSHNWGLPADQVWENFDNKNYSPGHAHIRYKHTLRDRGNRPL